MHDIKEKRLTSSESVHYKRLANSPAHGDAWLVLAGLGVPACLGFWDALLCNARTQTKEHSSGTVKLAQERKGRR
jgi:hypothetical protein